MDPTEFWKLIDSGVDDPTVVEDRIKEMSEQELVDFYWLHQDVVDEITYEEYAENFGSSYSEDHHEDVAGWVVRQGKAFYDDIEANPSKFPTEFPRLTRKTYPSFASRVYRERYGDAIRTQEEPPPAGA
jgi:hypothetical protein